MNLRLEHYALIGDCETAAVVSRHGSINWLCWPRFDSGACFDSSWILAPRPLRIKRFYRRDTLILETETETPSGAASVTDFMPPRGRNSDIVRLVHGRGGRVAMCMELVLRFDYGSVVP